MSSAYALAYRFGIAPREKSGALGPEQLRRLLDREQDGYPAYGRALDLGCGSGVHTIELSRRGWDVVGVDLLTRVVQEARDRGEQAGSPARFVAADVTDLPAEIGVGFRLVLDLGCFQGLPRGRRPRFGEQVTRVTQAGATLLMLACAPGSRFAYPRGSDADELESALPQWVITDVEPVDTTSMPPALVARTPRFYRLRRRADAA
jgi:SAM-dependent methyltransferase